MSESSIRALAHRYCDAISRGDEEQLRDTWSEHATWTLPPGRSATGREEIVALWKRAVAPTVGVIQVALNGECREVDGRWIGRWYVQEYIAKPEGSNLLIAFYDDEYVEEDGTWRFADRTMHWLYRGPSGMAIEGFTPLPSDLRLPR